MFAGRAALNARSRMNNESSNKRTAFFARVLVLVVRSNVPINFAIFFLFILRTSTRARQTSRRSIRTVSLNLGWFACVPQAFIIGFDTVGFGGT